MGTGAKVLTYFTKRITSIFLVLIILFMAMFIAYDCANIYVILEEGMGMRAEAVLMNEDVPLLNKFFTQNFLDNDQLLNNNKYENYMIVEYNYNLKMKKVWAWPWSRHAKATVQEIISDISGDIKDKENTPESPIPKWENGEKLVKLRKLGGRWVIDEIILERPLDKFD